MSLQQRVKDALAALPISDQPQILEAAEQGQQVSCRLEALDSLGCSFSSLVCQTEALADASLEKLRTVSQQLATRLNYLMEPIALMECDDGTMTVQLRSQPPQVDEDGASYYELLVRRGSIALCRWQARSPEPRQAIPAQVTRQVLLRLVGDFAAVS